MIANFLRRIRQLFNRMLAVPVRAKVIGIGLLPILILGILLNYWITTGLSDWLSYILADIRVQAAMEAGGRSVFLVTVLGTIISILFSLLLAHLLTEPILSLRQMVQQVANGDLNVRAEVWARDEIGELAVAINTMTDRLVTNQEDLARKNRNLDLLNQIWLAANRPDDIHDVLYTILELLVKSVRVEMGWAYLRDPERKTFHIASWYGVPEEMEAVFLSILSPSSCNCQHSLTAEGLDQHAQLRSCDRLERLTRLNLGKRHITIPLIAREMQYGVINLLYEDGLEFSEEDMELVEAVGKQVSEVIANAWLQIKLVEKEAARKALLESLARAQEEEQRRLAGELHDGAGQTMTSLLVRLKVLERKHPSPEMQGELASIQDIVSETIEQMRELAYRLRPVVLDEFGLSRALESLAEEMTRGSAIKMDYELDLQPGDIPKEIELVLFRIAQESLTNILRHSKAMTIRLSLTRDQSRVRMCIEDNGVGFDPALINTDNGRRHLGLISMRERAEMAGGTLDIYTGVGQGTSIEVLLPVLY